MDAQGRNGGRGRGLSIGQGTSVASNSGLQPIRAEGKPARTHGNATRGGGSLSKAWKQSAKVKTRHGSKLAHSGGSVAEAPTLSPEIDQGIVNAAYEAELNRFSGAIAAAEADQTKTPAERSAIVKALRSQRQGAAAARRAAMDAEKARVKAENDRQKPAKTKSKKPVEHKLT